jgi:DNA-binding MarR family transcriptional regulator
MSIAVAAAARASVASGSVTTVLDRLERMGYVRRVPDETDRGRVQVVPTPVVIEAATAIYGPLASEGAASMRRYTSDELALLVDATRRDRLLQEQHAARVRALPPLTQPSRKAR